MVAGLLLLSERPPESPRLAGLGDRFHYFRGASGRRYLFSVVAARELADFASAVVMVAHRRLDGSLAVASVARLDADGRPLGAVGGPSLVPPGCVVLVHLLAESEAARRAVVADLAAPATPVAAVRRSAVALAA
jgi:hypothetical protein